ncbi:MAG: bifunctional adenosylcobinamide kinase/adenosylcobinamide-phosphate guanylyltransferase [Deltaproteobacteria bacterium]|nr:bifunctional adenosylcobinamide kinase/adenosylcobinamide-phosphate guanylyltransferase [Deltaproteobacteria bacterium]
MDNKLTFIIGGARSGKTAFALKLASESSGKKVYLATAEAADDEMRLRIERHKAERGNDWRTIEEPLGVAAAINSLAGQDAKVIVIDCLTLWLSNSIVHADDVILDEATTLMRAMTTADCPVIAISNEVGWGIVPENGLARRFRDLAGGVNQMMAKAASSVYFVAAGIPLKLK